VVRSSYCHEQSAGTAAVSRLLLSALNEVLASHFLCQMRSSVVDPRATATRPMATPDVRVDMNLATVRPVYPANGAPPSASCSCYDCEPPLRP